MKVQAIKMCSLQCALNGSIFETSDSEHFAMTVCPNCKEKVLELSIQHLAELFIAMAGLDPVYMYQHMFAAEEYLKLLHRQDVKHSYN